MTSSRRSWPLWEIACIAIGCIFFASSPHAVLGQMGLVADDEIFTLAGFDLGASTPFGDTLDAPESVAARLIATPIANQSFFTPGADVIFEVLVLDTGNSRILYAGNSIADLLEPQFAEFSEPTGWRFTDILAQPGSGDGEVNEPTSAAWDAQGNLYVTDGGNNRVLKFNADLIFESFLQTTGDGAVDRPTGVVVDDAGDIYVAATDRVNKYNAQGQFVTSLLVGNPSNQSPPVDRPGQIAVDQNGLLLVTETGFAERLGFFDRQTGAPAGSIPFDDPRGVAVDPRSGDIYVSDHSQRAIFVYDSTGNTLLETLEDPPWLLPGPWNLAFDELGNLYIAQPTSNRVTVGRREISQLQLNLAIEPFLSSGSTTDDIYTSAAGADFRKLVGQAALTNVGRNLLNRFARDLSDEQNVIASGDLGSSDQIDNAGRALADMLAYVNGIRQTADRVIMGQPEEPLFNSYELEDPFYGRYKSSTPLFPLPQTATFELDPSTATTNIIFSPELGGHVVKPQVLASTVTLAIDSTTLAIDVLDFRFDFSSFELHGQQTGVNFGYIPDGAQVYTKFNGFSEFTAHGEGRIINDLYPATRPMFIFEDLRGFVFPFESEAIVWGMNEPILVPGKPDGPPTNNLADAFTAVRAEFLPSLGTMGGIVLHENTDPSLAPDISVIFTESGVFALELPGESVIGALFEVDPLLFQSITDSVVAFEDTAFQITNPDGIFVSGLFTGITLDMLTGQFFAAGVTFDSIADAVPSSFIDAWMQHDSAIQFLGVSKTAQLVAVTNHWMFPGMTDTDFIAIRVVPELSSWLLALATFMGLLCFAAWKRARLQSMA